MSHLSPDMQACMEECLKCHATCLSMAMTHCLQVGGKHTEPEHFKLMMSCAEMCQCSANVMAIGLDLHKKTCALCAEICTLCADNCEQVGDMDACVAQCRSCAEHCRSMAA